MPNRFLTRLTTYIPRPPGLPTFNTRPAGLSELRPRPAALFATPLRPFRAGDAVRCIKGTAKGRTGTVVSPGWDPAGSVRAGPDQVWVAFDGATEVARIRRFVIEQVL